MFASGKSLVVCESCRTLGEEKRGGTWSVLSLYLLKKGKASKAGVKEDSLYQNQVFCTKVENCPATVKFTDSTL